MFLLLDRVLSKKIVWPSWAFWLSVEAAGADAPDDGLDASLLDELPPPQAASITETEQITARESVRMAGIVFAGGVSFRAAPQPHDARRPGNCTRCSKQVPGNAQGIPGIQLRWFQTGERADPVPVSVKLT